MTEENLNELTEEETKVLRGLTDRGFAVIIWTPAELRGADPGDIEDWSIEHGYDVIDSLATEPSETDEENED